MQGSGVDVFAVQPGLTNTSLYSGMQKTFLFYWFFRTMTFAIGQCPDRGALSLLYCATAPELTGQATEPSANIAVLAEWTFISSLSG